MLEAISLFGKIADFFLQVENIKLFIWIERLLWYNISIDKNLVCIMTDKGRHWNIDSQQ